MLAGPYMMAATDMDMRMVNASVGRSINDDFFAMLMFMQMDKEMNMVNRMGVTSSMESSGLGDTMLMSKYLLYADDKLIPKSQASLFLGLNIPTGSIDEKDNAGALLPYGMQLGSGTWDPMIGALYSGSSSPWWWGASGIYTARLQDNDRDYRLGNELHLDAYAMRQIHAKVILEAQLNGHYQEEISGTMSGGMMPTMSPLWDTQTYGGTKLNLTLGVQWQPAPLHIINFQVGKPLNTNTNGPQMEEEYRFMLTWYKELITSKSRRAQGMIPSESKTPGKLGF